ncbi:MAG: tetratricopeptide repeat protein [PVC group bacterium]
MGAFVFNSVLFNLILRLLAAGGLEGFHQERSIREGEYWRERALAAPRSTYRKIHYYERSIEADPAVAAAHLELGEVYYDLAISYGHRDLFDSAVSSLAAALKADPSLVPAHYRLGLIYFLLGDFKSSRRELEEAHRLDPGYLPARNSLKMLREKLGEGRDNDEIRMTNDE